MECSSTSRLLLIYSSSQAPNQIKNHMFFKILYKVSNICYRNLCVGFLTHLYPTLPFYTPSKYQKTLGFLVFSGGVKWEYCWLKISNIYLLLLSGMKKHQFPSRHLFKVNTRNTSTRCEICSKLTMETLERRQ